MRASRFSLFLTCALAAACSGVPADEPDSGAAGGTATAGGGAGTAGGGTAGGGAAGGATAGGGAAGGTVMMDAGAGPPAVYPPGDVHSPITAAVAESLRRVAARGPNANARALSKVGDSNTVNTGFLNCFAGANVNLDTQAGALQPVLDAFRDGGTFARVSLAATVGWSAGAATAGAPSPLDQELAAVSPRFAPVMFGTNDVESMNVDSFGRNMFAIADQLIDAGVIPLITAVPPRDDNPASDLAIPRYNAVSRGIAQARQVPFIDLHRELLTMPAHGLGGDGIHLNVLGAGMGCVLTAAGLQYGQNRRNLLTLQALGRASRALSGAPAPDATAPTLLGSGTQADPYLISSLPFTDARDTRTAGTNRLSTYPGCAAAQDESGPELYYRLDLVSPTNLRAYVISLGTADVDVHLLGPGASGSDCLVRNDKVLTRAAVQGTLYLSLDTFVSAGTPQPGEYLVVVLADP